MAAQTHLTSPERAYGNTGSQNSLSRRSKGEESICWLPSISCCLIAKVSPSLHHWVLTTPAPDTHFWEMCHKSSGIKLVEGMRQQHLMPTSLQPADLKTPPGKPVEWVGGWSAQHGGPWRLSAWQQWQEGRAPQCEVRSVRGSLVWYCF